MQMNFPTSHTAPNERERETLSRRVSPPIKQFVRITLLDFGF